MSEVAVDTRRHSFFIVDNAVCDDYDLDPYEGWIYVHIVRRGDEQLSIDTLAEAARMSKSETEQAVKALEAKGLIRAINTLSGGAS